MKYLPSLPDKNDNVSHNNPFKEFLTLLLGLLVFVLLTYWSLGFCIDLAVNYISPETERRLFSVFPAKSQESSKDHAVEQEKLQRIMDNLRKCADINSPISVRIVDMPHSNAMAFPGGNVVVFSDLLKNVNSENGITFILAHELGHYINRDHLRGMGRGIVFVALSTLLTGTNSDLTSMLTPTSNFTQAQYSQDREHLADEAALRGMNCIFGHVGGATEFFENISKKQSQSKIPLSHYFGSHPEIFERIESLNRSAKKLGFATRPVTLNTQ